MSGSTQTDPKAHGLVPRGSPSTRRATPGSWLAGTQLLAVGRSDGGALVEQTIVVDALDEAIERVDVEVSGGTAAVVQVDRSGDSALSFLGCF